MKRVLLAAALVATACGGAADPEAGGGTPSPVREDLVATVASYDLAAGVPGRFLLGVITPQNELVTGGRAELRFFFLGEQQAEGEPELVDERPAEFLPIPEEEGDHEHAEGELPHGAGVFAVPEMTFERPGLYRVEATIDLQGEELLGTAAFTVLPEPQVPIAGDRAPRTENLTVDSDAPLEAIDSRAAAEGEIPDPSLHRATIADAIRAGRPVLAVFSTPVYCASRFCGPITDMVEDLAAEHGDAAEFVHVEIWRDFQNRVLNEAAADWLLHDDNLQEPWVFLIGSDGRILARWDNVATREEIEPWLERLG